MYLWDKSLVMGNPFPLKANAGKSFQGSIVLGKGFVISPEQAHELITKDARNKDVLFPYLNGDDLNNDPQQRPSRWVINFFDWQEEKARLYPDCFDIVEQLVKPERLAQNDKGGREKWWQFLRPRKELYETISKLDQVMAINRYTKYLAIDFQSNDVVFSDSIVVFTLNSFYHFSMYSSSMHDIWAWKNSSTMGSSTLRYSPTNSFETFPLIVNSDNQIENIGIKLYKLRKSIMLQNQIGFTELYNQFHSMGIDNIGFKESILELRKLHYILDELILKLYGWDDIALNYGFHEIEFLPENDRIRFTLDSIARKEIINRLLILNHELYKNQIESAPITQKKKKTGKSSPTIDLFSAE